MIINPRVYETIYTLLALAWIAVFPMIGAVRNPAFVSRYMVTVAGTASVVGAVNLIDWLWS